MLHCCGDAATARVAAARVTAPRHGCARRRGCRWGQGAWTRGDEAVTRRGADTSGDEAVTLMLAAGKLVDGVWQRGVECCSHDWRLTRPRLRRHDLSSAMAPSDTCTALVQLDGTCQGGISSVAARLDVGHPASHRRRRRRRHMRGMYAASRECATRELGAAPGRRITRCAATVLPLSLQWAARRRREKTTGVPHTTPVSHTRAHHSPSPRVPPWRVCTG